MENKICVKCKRNIAKDNYSYCDSCYNEYKRTWDLDNKEHIREYQKSWREEQKSNYIYMFIPTREEYPGEVLNIGSTINIKKRVGEHMRLETKASRVIKDNNREFNIVYVEIKEQLTREELYFIEYYLIHKYYAIQGVKPLGNDIITYATDICTSRQLELILIAEGLKFTKYDLFKNSKKNMF